MKDEKNINALLFHDISEFNESHSQIPEPVVHLELLDIVKRGDLAGLKECFNRETYIRQYRQAAGTKYFHENLSMTHGMIYLTAYDARRLHRYLRCSMPAHFLSLTASERSGKWENVWKKC